LRVLLNIAISDQCIYTFHKSFTDFILDPRRSPELTDAAASYFQDRTYDCFRIMNKSLQFNICNLTSSFLLEKDDEGLPVRVKSNIGPKLRYACRHWAAHLASVRHDRQEDMQQLSALLLDASKMRGVRFKTVRGRRVDERSKVQDHERSHSLEPYSSHL
jgi:hypothetical protein